MALLTNSDLSVNWQDLNEPEEFPLIWSLLLIGGRCPRLFFCYVLVQRLHHQWWIVRWAEIHFGFGNRLRTIVSFIAGQPPGYYGSWALFSLSHHFIVWLAAEWKLSSKAPFTRYAVLGDDVVIADPVVTGKYRELLDRMGVSISESKSKISSPLFTLYTRVR